MALIEAILLERPVISSSLSNALDVLGDAIAVATVEDPASYADRIRLLRDSLSDYEQLQRSCSRYREQFLDGSLGIGAVVERALLASASGCVER